LNDQPKEPFALKIVQAFNAQTNGGQTISSVKLLLVDFDMKNVLAVYSEEDLNSILSFSEEMNNISMQQGY